MFTALRDKFTVRFSCTAGPLLWLGRHRKARRTLIIAFCHLFGALTSIRAILDVRTSQGAIAWAVSLNTFPYAAVPAYWIFGRSDFQGYVVMRRANKRELTERQQQISREMDAMRPPADKEPASAKLLERLAMLP